MPIRTILIDDEANNNESLHFLLGKYCPDLEVTGTAENIIAGEELIHETNPDLVFLDIEMPYGNGFDLLNKLSNHNFAVIFVTAFDKYAIQAIRYAALDYLLKPINITDLKNAVEKAISHIREKDINRQISSLLTNLREPSPGNQRLALPVMDGLVFEKLENITHLTASGNYTHVFTKDRQKYLVAKTLKDFEDLLPLSLFCRIHHSSIINTSFIKKYIKGRGGYIELEDGTTLEVSARKKDEFLARFG